MFAKGKPPEHDTILEKKRSVFCEVFAEGKPLEHHTLVLFAQKLVKVGSWSKTQKMKVLRTGLPIVDFISGLQESFVIASLI